MNMYIANRRKKILKIKLLKILFKALNLYYKNIKLTIQINPIKFLDTYLHNKGRIYVTKLNRKKTKFSAH